MRSGLDTYRSTEAKLWRTHFLGLLAEALGKAGRVEEGLRILTEALETARDTGECYYEAELYRIRGELLVMQAEGAGNSQAAAAETSVAVGAALSVIAQAEACFEKAIAVARRQQAKYWELRAAISLSRLCLKKGERANGRQALEGIYGWFTEGSTRQT